MEDDSASSCEDRLLELEASSHHRCRPPKKSRRPLHLTDMFTKDLPSTSANGTFPEKQPRASVKIIERSLSSQVMEYYHKYSQSSQLDRYFSMPGSTFSTEAYKNYLKPQDQDDRKLWEARHPFLLPENQSDLPRERRCVRPPLIGQPSVSPEIFPGLHTEPSPLETTDTPEPDDKLHSLQDPEIISVDSIRRKDNTSLEPGDRDVKAASPTSSVTSHKPLEWDSGADVGYNAPRSKEKSRNMLCTIERMALARGLCSADLRLDPEGTTGSTVDPATQGSPSRSNRRKSKPDAHSTRINDVSESEGEIEITPIVKSNLPGIIIGKITGTEEVPLKSKVPQKISLKTENDEFETPKTSHPTSSKYATERFVKMRNFRDFQETSMKKSFSMNVLALPQTTIALKRSQSELNLRANEEGKKPSLPLNFSSSSIATIVNKPSTCDKDSQTNLEATLRESIGIQVSAIVEEPSTVAIPEVSQDSTEVPGVSDPGEVPANSSTSSENASLIQEEEQEKPPLPKRISSLSQTPQSILKTSVTPASSKKTSGSSSPETDGGRASNSFEYFPGHVYQNVPQAESTSHVSSVDTRRSHSTMPNTSSSLDEKLWGDSDSLLRDLERSLNILKSLVDANKCDKHVKKRLIHHVIKRLVSAKYVDDKISHDLQETVPWEPENARTKVYRAEIIQALAQKQKGSNQRTANQMATSNSTEESSGDWKPSGVIRKRSASVKAQSGDSRILKEMIQLVASSENSDLFEGRHTDRTDGMQDGRKARMGLRSEDRHRHQLQRDLPLDTEKSESSECFLPQQINYKSKDTKAASTEKTPSPSSTNSNERRRGGDDKMNWRLPATMSERRFELERCNYRGAATTRLIDYVEMEKKNQLVWISNEIDHLSNLKKLLEDPKSCERKENLGKSAEKNNVEEDFSGLTNQWSSHGNLAERRERTLKKKNSCTQTGKGAKSGEERIEGIEDSRVRNSCVQTGGPSLRESWSPRRSCLVHGNKRGVCQCARPGGETQGVGGGGEVRSGTNSDTKKEAKNRLNDKCRSEVNLTEYRFSGKGHCRGCRCSQGKSREKSDDSYGKNTDDEGKGRGEHCTCSREKSGEKFSKNVEEGRGREKREERDVRSCRTCGTVYTSVDKKCQCNLSYVKPIAYELNFEEEGRRGRRCRGDSSGEEKSCDAAECDCGPPQPILRDYLRKNKPEFVDDVETRKRYMSELSELRQLKKEKRMQFLAMASPNHLIGSPRNHKTTVKSQRKISDDEMKMRLRLRYLRLNEVRNKRHQKEKEEAAKRNHLMAKIFCKKLQQKVLRGEVDLSQSVSVISNL